MNKNKLKYIIGIDEVGRGPLAGPLAVGAFVAPRGFDLRIFKGARDSKKMSAGEREECFGEIKKELKKGKLNYVVSFVSSQKIDKLGLTKAINLAIHNCLKKLNLDPKKCLVFLDGALRAPSSYPHQKTIIKGDDKEKIISLASIVAKVSRDRRMVHFSKLYPSYNFHKHKGYGTLEHRQKIKKFGLSPIHRRSFLTRIIAK